MEAAHLVLPAGFRIRIRIQEGKMTHKNRKKYRIFFFFMF
jgi:hypothetical protein